MFSQQNIDKQLVRDITDVINVLQENKITTFSAFLQLKTESEFLLALNAEHKTQIWDVFQSYLLHKKQEKLFDFIDLLVHTYQILSNDPHTLNQLRKRYVHLMVDEFQDTNSLQFDLLQLLTNAGKKIKITVVGDPDQTIYGWRGSKIDFILNFDRYFPNLNTIKLVQNYRSQENIVTLANQVIAKNRQRIVKNIIAVKPPSEQIILNLDYSSFKNGIFIVNQIEKLLQHGIPAKEITILYRVNYLSAVLEKLLLERGISYHIFKGQEFFKRKEIKELLVLLRILVDPRDLYLETVLS